MIRFWTSSRNFFVGSNIDDFSLFVSIFWLCSFPCGPGSDEVDVYPCGPGSDEVDVLSVRPRFRRSRCLSVRPRCRRSRCLSVRPRFRRSRCFILHLFPKVIFFDLSFYWIKWEWENCFFTSCYSSSLEYVFHLKSSSNFFSYVHLRYSVRSKSNPNFCWLEF